MKNFVLVLLLISCLISCKEKQTDPPTPMGTEESSVELPLKKAYAEISIAQGGEWIDGSRGHKEYSAGTSFINMDSIHVPKEHTDHSWFIRYEGPGWENNQVGYRLYLDWRNAIDIFGKKVDTLVLPFIGQDGFDSYHEPANWGQDILKAGKSMGLGGFGRVVADTTVHFQNVEHTFAKIDNAENSASVMVSYKGWQSGSERIDLKSKLTIFTSDRHTKVELIPSKKIKGLCTGIVDHDVAFHKKEGEKWAYIATYGKQTLTSPPDHLGMALFYKLDEVAEQKKGDYDHLVIFNPTTAPITYYFLGAWEQEPNGIKNEDDFLKDINSKLRALDKTNSIL
ncbi:DUF4861 family protein [Aestuariivivens sediminis]|uniref:DUF4861 family protein n=1 Tax=Aestuariivivens sediminis TaxID=2913557 RepID=UPI001F5ADAC5|nr:DUF4861 family protein [Aestuariivivens sediminis]